MEDEKVSAKEMHEKVFKRTILTVPFNNIRTLKFKPQPNCVFRYRQSNVRRRHPASNNCRALFRCLNCVQRFDYRGVLGSSRKRGVAAEHLIDGSVKRICRLSFEF